MNSCQTRNIIFIIAKMVVENRYFMPPEVFSAVGLINRPRLSTSATEYLLDGIREAFGISNYRLALLLGTTSSTMNRWVHGERTPSPVYLGRMLQLWIWDSQGMVIGQMSAINWDTSMILWGDGRVTCENHLPGGSGEVAPENRRPAWEMAELLSQQLRQTGSLDNRKGRLSVNGATPPP